MLADMPCVTSFAMLDDCKERSRIYTERSVNKKCLESCILSGPLKRLLPRNTWPAESTEEIIVLGIKSAPKSPDAIFDLVGKLFCVA